MTLALRQTGALARRSVTGTLRTPQALFPSLFFPLVLMAIFTASFGNAPGNIPGFPPVRSFLDFALAGAIVQGILIGGTTAGAAFALDIEGGFFDRLVASPVSRTAILAGRLLGGVTLAMAQTVLFVTVGIVFGARVEGGVAGVLILLLLAALMAVAVSGLGIILALRTGSAEAVQGTFPRFSAQKHPRSAIGFSRDSGTVYLVAVDGRQETSDGMSLVELGDFLLSIGVYQGMNFDGGGSTALVIKGKLANHPSDAAGERAAGNAVLVRERRP